jgi:hypothetical protein
MRGITRYRSITLTLWVLTLAAIAQPSERPAIRYRNTDPAVPYSGSKSCSPCHARLAVAYRKTPMGSSMAPANRPEELARVRQPVTIFKGEFNRYFRVFQKGGDLYQSEYQLDAAGKTMFEATHKLEYVIGAGLHGYTYVIKREGRLLEAPLSYYSRPANWDLSPGYEDADLGFNRPVLSGCLVCHNGQPVAVPNHEGQYGDPPFRFGECAISCEACHGPGSIHVREGGHGVPRGAVDTSIVNPLRLPARLSDDICMDCHQGGHSRVLVPGKDYMDFRPGTPLDEVAAIFRVPLKPEQREKADKALTGPPVRFSLEMPGWWENSAMQMSRCYRESGGKLRCVTCHKIHTQPTPATKAAFYRDKCLTCHTERSCSIPLAQRMAKTPANDCVGCHMPKRPVGGIAHTALTIHRIVRRPGQPLPDYAFNEPTDVPGLVYLNRSDASKPVSPVEQLAAYGEIMQQHPELEVRYNSLLDELSRSHPDDPTVLAALGRRALVNKEYEKAGEYLSKALERGSEDTTTFLDLGQALSAAGKHAEAAAIFERGIGASPFAPELQKSLALEYITLKQYSRAHEVMQRYVELFPEDSFMRGLLEKTEASAPPR